MPCECCAVQFSVFKRKRMCCECERLYCSGCLRRGGGTMCAPCRLLSTRPLSRHNIAHLKVRDLQCFLKRQNVSTRGCFEKDELVSLCVSHVNSASYRRRGGRTSAFTSLKGLTSNINEFINSTFCTTPPTVPTEDSCRGNCFNSTHIHRPGPPPQTTQPPTERIVPSERFTTTPGGERDIHVPVPEQCPSPQSDGVARDTADCFEIEDLDDTDWEFVTRPADPLPQDSEVLITATDNTGRPASPSAPSDDSDRDSEDSPQITRATFARDRLGPGRFAIDENGPGAPQRPEVETYVTVTGLEPPSPGGPARATSELELRGPGHARDADTLSLKDEAGAGRGAALRIEDIRSESELEALSVRQLKEVLTRSCVAYRGCVERGELVAHCRRLLRARAAAPPPDDLPPEDACKICMAAPLECVLLECGHIATCAACARLLPECPICRRYVARAVRFFRS